MERFSAAHKRYWLQQLAQRMPLDFALNDMRGGKYKDS
jgi:hypothetical protein